VRIKSVIVFVFSINWLFLLVFTDFSPKLKSLHSHDFGEKIMSIYVGNLSYAVTQEDISNVFAEYGSVKRVVLPTDRETGRLRGFAFVEMGSDAEEASAIEGLDGAEWMGRDLKVNKAKPKEDRGSFGGNRGAYNGGGRSRY
jgi:RNA recognition motif-containing protein